MVGSRSAMLCLLFSQDQIQLINLLVGFSKCVCVGGACAQQSRNLTLLPQVPYTLGCSTFTKGLSNVCVPDV